MLPEDAHYGSKHRSTTRDPDELKTDLKLLLECLKYHENDPEVLKDGLLTVSSICLESVKAQDDFRESGGLNFVLNLLTTTDHESILESAMYTLGCATERNVFSQKRLCKKTVFRFLECNLINKKSSAKLKQTVSYLLLCLVTNNSTAQALINTSHCLDALLDIFRNQFPDYQPCPDSPSQFWSDRSVKSEGSSIELWKTVTSTLTGCINNPQNDANQLKCASVFSAALDILRGTENPQIMRLLASFLSLTAANNGKNQDCLGMLGGMEVIVNALQTVVEALIQQPSPDTSEAAVQLASLLVSCVTDNEWNKTSLADLRAVPLLVQLLALEVIDTEVKFKVILTLGHLTEGCEKSQRQLVESDGLGLIVHTMTGQQDEEFTKAATYVLHTCVEVVKSSDETRLAPDTLISQKSSVSKRAYTNAKGLPIPMVKPQFKVRKTPTTNNSSEKDELVSRISTSTRSSGMNTKCQKKVTEESEEEINTKHDQRETIEEERAEQLSSNDTTIEALFKEISTRKELELKLQEEIKTRENLEAEKLDLEKREEERLTTENISKQKAQALTQELERQYLMATKKQGPDLISSGDQQSDVKAASKLDNDSAAKRPKQPITQSSNKEVQILGKKVEQLEKQLKHHITHNVDQQSVHNASTFCVSCGSVGSVELSPQQTRSGPTSAISSPVAGGENIVEDYEMEQPTRKKTLRGKRSDESHGLLSHRIKNRNRQDVTKMSGISVESSQSANTTGTFRSSVERSQSNVAKSVFEPTQQRETMKSSQSVESNRSKSITPNIRHATRSQLRESVFRFPSSTITKKQKSLKQDKSSQVDTNSGNRSNETGKKRSSTPRPTFAEEVLPYKQQRYTSPLVLPKHMSSTPNNDESDLESVLSEVTDCYSMADSGVSWSDVKLKLPVCPVGRKSKVKKATRSKEYDENANSIKSSASTRSKHSYVVRYVKSHAAKEKGRQSNTMTSPGSSTSISHCPGCNPPVHRPLLTSRNFLYTLERSRHTCPEHRELQKAIKQHINNRKKLIEKRTSQASNASKGTTKYHVPCTVSVTPIKGCWTPSSSQFSKELSVEESTPKSESSVDSQDKSTGHCNKPRRKRQDFSQEEIDNLIAGVHKSGKHWNYILWSYRFKPGRTSIDLKDKYRRMQAQNVPGVLPKSPANKQAKKRLFWK